MSKVVLITGASSGIGHATAKLLAEHGYRVFGTSRHPTSETLDGFEMLTLDVRSDESVRNCVRTVIERAGHIDVLMNNAGIDFVGAVEETSLDEVRDVMETNFFGVVRMVQAVVPHMRARRNGQIINMSSGFGRIAFPFEVFYCASKHALEGYSEGLYYEMILWNIKVNCVEPGFYRTQIAQHKGLPTSPNPVYDDTRERALKLYDWSAETGGDPIHVARKVLHIIDKESNQLRHPVGWESVVVSRLSLSWLLIMPGKKLGRWFFGVDSVIKDLLRAAPFAIVGSVLAFVWRRSKR
jgi:NAD(P)-dependent dehydrogenase (short-subunit alcohol dehydrogenase family)